MASNNNSNNTRHVPPSPSPPPHAERRSLTFAAPPRRVSARATLRPFDAHGNPAANAAAVPPHGSPPPHCQPPPRAAAAGPPPPARAPACACVNVCKSRNMCVRHATTCVHAPSRGDQWNSRAFGTHNSPPVTYSPSLISLLGSAPTPPTPAFSPAQQCVCACVHVPAQSSVAQRGIPATHRLLACRVRHRFLSPCNTPR